ncbi:glutamyl-tRNA(Gln) amidotransferase subunit E [Candidatus Marsarchaeota G2 archaeon ECH_B_SAG-G16]|jgi:glutamyl-tRNA(Gln) amidotransferase subunit E|uniref:Glutamyl-tRNA(Gln) amidotransferase subunit E n=4 Tax=Candidatus Marsarchaeota TaxID=1978152 RepID=A0A2R6AEM9_9ARCH|nr:MAG: glutamyl-tRNA(Gln) amidotransferase subunit E [Candidatus Marsarchaeota G1 archaeon OSP_D]PSN84835.1 MAG: glutamyl-tRNA(Gln) amidotransferase subunit E [Candidatus Marsarchaeota G1 archaeon BE_D]PSN95360.1 MAG: glutamyl-tRNA(Gln) amidotransferase subunit E [Candidatus Marsarchaeota G1 archaeon OSP_B]PSO04533.1 MAG: glutamyl-tRNA(Gln) amidotransferase subunit E [Candidatus Marsarchaeota G2 archaeon ECH_B_SAG-G16]
MKVGLEVHQQLDTQHKLFCNCPTKLSSSSTFSFKRQLRASRSELGEVDVAAKFEEMRSRVFIYEANPDTSCLVEMDEEPPHELNKEALEVALMVAQLLDARPVDEIHVMRKLVIDGSNTSGFQRTALIATGGKLKLDGKEVRIATICLEEDAARPIQEDKAQGVVVYRLDRLGIPLIEISTYPDISSPEEAERVALEIGRILRRTRKVKRGLGTIRQDLNISIEGGARVEVKGVQELSLIPKIVEFEMKRQEGLLNLKREISSKMQTITFGEITDLSELFSDTRSKMLSEALKRSHKILGIKVSGFKGYFAYNVAPGRRFGTELADYVRQLTGVGGLIHSDELPNYGITQDEVERVRSALLCEENDGFVIVVAPLEKAKSALEVVTNRIVKAMEGVVEETRAPQADGTTRFSRPMPGSARMYPETDVPHIVVDEELLQSVRQSTPPPLEQTVKTLIQLGVSAELAKQAIDSDFLRVIERVANEIPESAKLACVLLLQDLKEAQREGLSADTLTDEQLFRLFRVCSKENIDRETAKLLLRKALMGVELEEALKEIRSKSLSVEELRSIIREVLAKNSTLLYSKKEASFKALMGEVMEKVRGRAPGSLVASELSRLIKEQLEKS